jgi:uncharacterized membrane protein
VRFLACAALLAAVVPVAPAAVITDYDVQVVLDRDGSFAVAEQISVDFASERRHGIFRRIPVVYDRQVEIGRARVPTRYTIRLRVGNVTDEAGRLYPTRVERQGRNVTIRIGDPSRWVTGRHTYRIAYRVAHAINYFPERDELYWNATGTEWEWPIEHAACTVILPEGADTSRVEVRTFTGPYGARKSAAHSESHDRIVTASTERLGTREGLTVVLGLPKGLLVEPSRLGRLGWWLADNAEWMAMLLTPVVAFASMLGLYRRYGRDPQEAKLPVAVEYAPPADLTPAEVGTLVDERADVADVVATVLDLAVRGFLRLREIEATRLLFFSSRDYELIRLKEPDAALHEHERQVMDALFRLGSSVRLSQLKNRFYLNLPDIRDALYAQLVERQLFPVSPATVRRRYLAAALLLPLGIGLLFFAAPVLSGYDSPSAFIQPILIAALASPLLTGAVIALFARVMPRKTARGVRLARQALGFKEFVERVERPRLERMAREDAGVFERLLPYAVVLGVADEWAEKFHDLVTAPPTWYESSSFEPGRFQPRVFVNDLGSGMHVMASTFTSAPSGSGGGGGSSGFGGGGVSGGGFGGGGGGGW